MLEQVLGYPGSLCLPVQPKTPGAVMDMVPDNLGINGRMKLDPADFRAGEHMAPVNVMDMVILNHREHAD